MVHLLPRSVLSGGSITIKFLHQIVRVQVQSQPSLKLDHRALPIDQMRVPWGASAGLSP
jgi:hypothetical protein